MEQRMQNERFVFFLKKKVPRFSAFTLVELLIVIAIVAVLATILIPALNSVSGSARSAGCVSNLRQLDVAIKGYIADNDGYFPPSQYRHTGSASDGWISHPGAWLCDTLTNYFPSPDFHVSPLISFHDSFSSPSWNVQYPPTYQKAKPYWCPGDNNPAKRPVKNAFASYAQNGQLGDDHSQPIVIQQGTGFVANTGFIASHAKPSAMTNASKIIYLIDNYYPNTAFGGANIGENDYPVSNGTTTNSGGVDFRHPGNTANALFVDGSIRPLTLKDLAGTTSQYLRPLPDIAQ